MPPPRESEFSHDHSARAVGEMGTAVVVDARREDPEIFAFVEDVVVSA